MTGSPAPEHQWRIIVDGHPNSGHWIDVADGDFQNIDCVGRLEFRAKPPLAAETGPEKRTASDWCAGCSASFTCRSSTRTSGRRSIHSRAAPSLAMASRRSAESA